MPVRALEGLSSVLILSKNELAGYHKNSKILILVHKLSVY